MIWEDTALESYVFENLPTKIGKSKSDKIIAHYVSARASVLAHVLPEIKAAEPHLSDHGPEHIRDVLENAWIIVSDKDKCPVNMFLLCVSILYHDVGNIFGREDHNKRIATVFNSTYPDGEINRNQIRTLIVEIAGAHTGKGRDGSDDTLKFLRPSNLFKVSVQSQELAAVLRFADELAEGPQRTSSFRIDNGLYDEGSSKFHIYADCCNPPHVERGNNRIALSYNIPILRGEGKKSHQLLTKDHNIELKTLLEFILGRILKLDQERKYCKHYSEVYLTDFRKTSVAFEFWLNDEDRIDIERPALLLDDLVIPGVEGKTIPEMHPQFKTESILTDLRGKIDA